MTPRDPRNRPVLLATLLLVLAPACAGGPEIDRGDPETGPATAGARVPGERPDGAPGSGRPGDAAPAPDLETARASIGGVAVVLEVADDDDERARGLAGRTALAPDTGMIFVYPEAEPRSFWMRGCLIGLDVAYLDDDRRVIGLASLDAPRPDGADMPRYASPGPARYVIEMEQGWFARRGLGVGERVVFSPELAARAEAVAAAGR